MRLPCQRLLKCEAWEASPVSPGLAFTATRPIRSLGSLGTAPLSSHSLPQVSASYRRHWWRLRSTPAHGPHASAAGRNVIKSLSGRRTSAQVTVAHLLADVREFVSDPRYRMGSLRSYQPERLRERLAAQ